MSVRAATPADGRAIAEVRILSWRATYGPYLPESVWQDVDIDAHTSRFERGLEDGTMTALVAGVDGCVHAFAIYGPCRDADLLGAGEVMAIYVHPEHFSRGLGRALLSTAIEELAARPVVLWVLENNARARRFYEVAGFRPDGARKPAQLLGGVELPEIRYRLD